MSILYFLVPLSALFVAIGVGLFIWASRRGQFDDLDKAAWSILFDDEPQPETKQPEAQSEGEDHGHRLD